MMIMIEVICLVIVWVVGLLLYGFTFHRRRW